MPVLPVRPGNGELHGVADKVQVHNPVVVAGEAFPVGHLEGDGFFGARSYGVGNLPLQAFVAFPQVIHAAVGKDALGYAVGKVLLVYNNGSALYFVCCEYACSYGGHITYDKSKVLLAGFSVAFTQ